MSIIDPVRPSFLGRGFAYPFRLDNTKTKPAFTADEQRVLESIDAIVNTNVGERPLRVKNGVPYGTRFRGLLFSSLEAASDVAKYDCRVALSTWEPRIVVTDVSLAEYVFDAPRPVKGALLSISFRFRSTNRFDNYVRPYRTSPE